MSHPYYEMLAEWQHAAIEAKKWQNLEKQLRDRIFSSTFQEPQEGVNKYTLPDGRMIKGTHKLYRKLDEAAYPSIREALINSFQIDPEDTIIKRKPEIATGPYKELPDEIRTVLDDAIIAKPGSPTIEIV